MIKNTTQIFLKATGIFLVALALFLFFLFKIDPEALSNSMFFVFYVVFLSFLWSFFFLFWFLIKEVIKKEDSAFYNSLLESGLLSFLIIGIVSLYQLDIMNFTNLSMLIFSIVILAFLFIRH